MTTPPMLTDTERDHARNLRRQLTARLLRGSTASATAWRQAFLHVPRELFVPSYFHHDDRGNWETVTSTNPAQRAQWLDTVYRDETLIIQLADVPIPEQLGGGTQKMWTSSSTAPSLMLRMLADLDVTDGQRILEIGTGSGYNAALLCARLGAVHVTSIDISPELVTAARARLAHLGQNPTLVAADGANGHAPNAPYDRLIATCAVERIPTAWLEQLRPGGIILTDWRRLIGGTLIKLRTQADGTAIGRFTPQWGGFMYLRHDPAVSLPIGAAPDLDAAVSETSTTVDPGLLLTDERFLFLVQVRLPDCRLAQTTVPDTGQPALRITSDDGSWCEVTRSPSHGRYRLHEGGTRPLWTIVEDAYDWWQRHGRPSWQSFGMTATTTDQWIWFERPDNTDSWTVFTVG